MFRIHVAGHDVCLADLVRHQKEFQNRQITDNETEQNTSLLNLYDV